MTKRAAVSYLLLPYARAAAQSQVLLARVALVNPGARGGRSPHIVPDHAGQWGLIGGAAPAEVPADQAAVALFRQRTGIALDDPGAAARFAVLPPAIRTLADAERRQFTAVYWETSAAGLAALADAINRAIGGGETDGVIAEAAPLPLAEALSRMGPVPKPAGGWGRVIVEQVYGGRLPQAMDTTYPTLVNQLAARSQQSAEPFRIALEAMPTGMAALPSV
jgi:hypothetical protein